MYLLQGMLDSSVLPIVSQWDSYEELLFNQVAAASHFVLLFLRYLVTVFQMGLGVQGPTEWPTLSQPHSMCFLFVELGQRGSLLIKTKNT